MEMVRGTGGVRFDGLLKTRGVFLRVLNGNTATSVAARTRASCVTYAIAGHVIDSLDARRRSASQARRTVKNGNGRPPRPTLNYIFCMIG